MLQPFLFKVWNIFAQGFHTTILRYLCICLRYNLNLESFSPHKNEKYRPICQMLTSYVMLHEAWRGLLTYKWMDKTRQGASQVCLAFVEGVILLSSFESRWNHLLTHRPLTSLFTSMYGTPCCFFPLTVKVLRIFRTQTWTIQFFNTLLLQWYASEWLWRIYLHTLSSMNEKQAKKKWDVCSFHFTTESKNKKWLIHLLNLTQKKTNCESNLIYWAGTFHSWCQI